MAVVTGLLHRFGGSGRKIVVVEQAGKLTSAKPEKEDETMFRTWLFLAGLLVFFLTHDAAAKSPNAAPDAVPPSAQQITALRAHGPDGLVEALGAYDRLCSELTKLQ